MEPETKPALPEAPPDAEAAPATLTPRFSAPAPEPRLFRWVSWACIGDQGLRAGWSVSIFAILFGADSLKQ